MLRVIDAGRDIEELVALPMQYSQILALLRSMIADGLIDRVEAKLILTQAGRDAILQPPADQASTVADPLDGARTRQTEHQAVHVPRGVIR